MKIKYKNHKNEIFRMMMMMMMMTVMMMANSTI